MASTELTNLRTQWTEHWREPCERALGICTFLLSPPWKQGNPDLFQSSHQMVLLKITHNLSNQLRHAELSAFPRLLGRKAMLSGPGHWEHAKDRRCTLPMLGNGYLQLQAPGHWEVQLIILL